MFAGLPFKAVPAGAQVQIQLGLFPACLPSLVPLYFLSLFIVFVQVKQICTQNVLNLVLLLPEPKIGHLP